MFVEVHGLLDGVTKVFMDLHDPVARVMNVVNDLSIPS